MKKIILASCATIALSACTNHSAGPETVGMANPASVYCLEQGGTLEPKKDAQGNEYALCHLPDGTVIEEWEFYRRNHK